MLVEFYTTKVLLMEKTVLTLNDLCNYTGYARSYVYKLNMAGKIPGGSKPGGRKLFFDREKIDAWLLGSPILTEEEKESKASTYISTHSLTP
jgi:excisionase family DNA binding protein